MVAGYLGPNTLTCKGHTTYSYLLDPKHTQASYLTKPTLHLCMLPTDKGLLCLHQPALTTWCWSIAVHSWDLSEGTCHTVISVNILLKHKSLSHTWTSCFLRVLNSLTMCLWWACLYLFHLLCGERKEKVGRNNSLHIVRSLSARLFEKLAQEHSASPMH